MIEGLTASGIAAIILAVGTALAGVITAWRTGQKVDQVHRLVNKNYSELKAELAVALEELASEKVTAAKAETTRAVLASETVKQALPAEVARALDAAQAVILAAGLPAVVPVLLVDDRGTPPQADDAAPVTIPAVTVAVRPHPIKETP
jgi:hypothetical protein